MTDLVWTDAQFEEMSWHDNYVHGFRIVEGEHGFGELILDIDYILEWVAVQDQCQFRIVPATLRFFEVADLRLSLDYATPTAALTPFSLHSIERKFEKRERYTAQLWELQINWPTGKLTFQAKGFEQRARGAARLSSSQYLAPQEREPGA
jgi:hypothetical protein